MSSLADNLSDRLHSDNSTDCNSYVDYMSIKDNQLTFRCFDCKKNYKEILNIKLTKRFASIYELCDKYINKLFLLFLFVFIFMNIWIAGKKLIKH